MIQFAPSEAMEFAVRIEENGETFYRRMAEKFEDPELKELFTWLANEEIKHRSTYAGMVEKLQDYSPEENYPEEYFSYLRAYVESVIFSPQRLKDEMERIETLEEALDFAIRTELENILYFEEMKKLIKKEDQHHIEEIIEEERLHFLRLSSLKKTKTK